MYLLLFRCGLAFDSNTFIFFGLLTRMAFLLLPLYLCCIFSISTEYLSLQRYFHFANEDVWELFPKKIVFAPQIRV